MDSDHRCPAPRCPHRVPGSRPCCVQHWYQLPQPVRAAIYLAWSNGAGTGSPAHDAAVGAAIEFLNR